MRTIAAGCLLLFIPFLFFRFATEVAHNRYDSSLFEMPPLNLEIPANISFFLRKRVRSDYWRRVLVKRSPGAGIFWINLPFIGIGYSHGAAISQAQLQGDYTRSTTPACGLDWNDLSIIGSTTWVSDSIDMGRSHVLVDVVSKLMDRIILSTEERDAPSTALLRCFEAF